MESILFTTLSATEEANLSGGTYSYVKYEKYEKTTKYKKVKHTPVKKYTVVKVGGITIDVKTFTNVIAGKDNDGNVQINQG